MSNQHKPTSNGSRNQLKSPAAGSKHIKADIKTVMEYAVLLPSCFAKAQEYINKSTVTRSPLTPDSVTRKDLESGNAVLFQSLYFSGKFGGETDGSPIPRQVLGTADHFGAPIIDLFSTLAAIGHYCALCEEDAVAKIIECRIVTEENLNLLDYVHNNICYGANDVCLLEIGRSPQGGPGATLHTLRLDNLIAFASACCGTSENSMLTGRVGILPCPSYQPEVDVVLRELFRVEEPLRSTPDSVGE